MMIKVQYLLDTNIISELAKPEPNKGVIEFVSTLGLAGISTVTWHELEYGIGLLPEGERRVKIQKMMNDFIKLYEEAIFGVGELEARSAAKLRVTMKQSGKIMHLADSLIAGTAQVHNLTLITRNTKDFDGSNIALLNPFS